MGRFATGLVLAVLLLPLVAHATTAPSLSDRIKIDGVLDEYAADEFVLDATSLYGERDDDSGWGATNDIARFAITWDHDFLYLGVDGRAFDTFFALFASSRAGGLHSLEDAGDFRRAIEIPEFPINLMALAQPERIPSVARADDSHPFGLVDRTELPRATSGVRGGVLGFEMAVPWTMLSLSGPVRLVAAVTGEIGTGVGDAAPGGRVKFGHDRFVRAVLDGQIVLSPDADGDGVADAGVSPRTAAVIVDWATPTTHHDADLEVRISPRAFAPDRAETAALSYRVDTERPLYLSASVYSLDGKRVRVLFTDDFRGPIDGALPSGAVDAWNGTDEANQIVRGGAYVVTVEWGFAPGERLGRATAAVVVVR